MSKENTMRINIYDLVDGYSKRTSEKVKDEFLKSQVKTLEYLDYGIKTFLADNIVLNSFYKDGNIHIDSCRKYMLYIYTLLKYWTNIDIEENNLIKQYDLLNKNGLIEKIIELISDKEKSEFSTILAMKEDDFMSNFCNTSIQISNKFTQFSPILISSVDRLLGAISSNLEKTDKSILDKFLNK